MARPPRCSTAGAGPGHVMTVAQVADYLQLNRLTVYRYVRDGRLPAARIGRVYRILREDVDRFLEARRLGGRGAARPPEGRPSPVRPDEIYVGPQFRPRPSNWDPMTTPDSPVDWILRVLH